MSFQIFIKNYKGQKREVCVNSKEELKNMTVKEFIRRFFPEEEHLEKCIYIFEGKRLEGDRTLGYDIEHGSTIHIALLPCLRGGGPDGDEDKGMFRTESMDRLANMQQTEPESKRLCCIL